MSSSGELNNETTLSKHTKICQQGKFASSFISVSHHCNCHREMVFQGEGRFAFVFHCSSFLFLFCFFFSFSPEKLGKEIVCSVICARFNVVKITVRGG